MTRKKIIAGNWKMNPSLSETDLLTDSLKNASLTNNNQVILIPPFTHINMLYTQFKNTAIKIGAQTLSHHDNGAYTGEISASMLKEFGCEYVLIGHSERRQYHNETDLILNLKLNQALKHQLTPIFCIGESLKERENDQTLSIIKNQLTKGLANIILKNNNDNPPLIIAYEPVWAIGTGQVATPEQAEEVHHYIRVQLHTLLGKEHASICPILYGGSVKPNNSHALFQQTNIDGGLIGGASLNANDFIDIINALQLTAI